jgi:DNA (cytosine-5)-methyltransferase 1
MGKIRIATVFSGIGAFEYALRRLNVPHTTVFACDNGDREVDIDSETELGKIKLLNKIEDKVLYVDELYKRGTKKSNFVQKSYEFNYKNKTQYFFQDIRLLDGSDFNGKIDILVGGSPCQSFSTIGAQKGLDDARGTLFYDFARLINEIKPKVFIFENVRGLYTHDKKNTWSIIYNIFQSSGYKVYHKLLNAKFFGIPQNRTRLFVVGFISEEKFSFPEGFDLQYQLNDFRIDNVKFGNFNYSNSGKIQISKGCGIVDDKYKLSAKIENYVMKSGTKSFFQKPEIDLQVARPLLKTMGNNHRAGIDNYFSFKNGVRMLTEREALRLMGFTDEFGICVSKSQVYKQAGNSIVVDVLMALLEEILKTTIFNGGE